MTTASHVKGPEKEGSRNPVYFATKADYIEGFNDRLTTQAEATPTKSGLMSAADKSKLLGAVLNMFSPGATTSTLEPLPLNVERL